MTGTDSANAVKRNCTTVYTTNFMICLSSGFVYVTVRSEGFEDRKKGRMLAGRARAYIKVNGKERSLRRRGFNVVVINGKTGQT